MVKSLLIALAVMFSVPGVCIAADPAQRAAEVVKAYKKRSDIQEIEVVRAVDRGYTFAIWYKKRQTSAEAIAKDTGQLVRDTLRRLVADGQKPADQMIAISVHAYSREAGETKQRVRAYGTARYNYIKDDIEFKLK